MIEAGEGRVSPNRRSAPPNHEASALPGRCDWLQPRVAVLRLPLSHTPTAPRTLHHTALCRWRAASVQKKPRAQRRISCGDRPNEHPRQRIF